MQTKVSFVTSVKNRPIELKEMIQSLINQDIPDWEAIIVDDHSSEPIQAVIDEFHDTRLYYYKLSKDKTGISHARNFAIKKAVSEIIIIADADDINEPFRARITYNNMIHNKCDVFYGNKKIFVTGQRKRGSRFQPFNAELLRMYNFIPNPAAAFRKDEFLKSNGYDPNLLLSEDYDLWLRFLSDKAKFCYTRKVLVNYRVGRKGISRKKKDLMHHYIQKTRIKNKIEPLDLNLVKNYARPGIARSILSKKSSFRDDRFQKK